MKERKQITLRVPEEVYEALKSEADQKLLSIHEMIMIAIDYFLERKSSDTGE